MFDGPINKRIRIQLLRIFLIKWGNPRPEKEKRLKKEN